MQRRWVRNMLGGGALILVSAIAAWTVIAAWPVCIYTSEDAARNQVRSTAWDISIWDLLHPDEPDGWEAELPSRVVILERAPGGWPLTLTHETLEDYACIVQNPTQEADMTVRCGSRERLEAQ
jgi:hypothetical protein